MDIAGFPKDRFAVSLAPAALWHYDVSECPQILLVQELVHAQYGCVPARSAPVSALELESRDECERASVGVFKRQRNRTVPQRCKPGIIVTKAPGVYDLWRHR